MAFSVRPSRAAMSRMDRSSRYWPSRANASSAGILTSTVRTASRTSSRSRYSSGRRPAAERSARCWGTARPASGRRSDDRPLIPLPPRERVPAGAPSIPRRRPPRRQPDFPCLPRHGKSSCPLGKRSTSNIQHSTSNVQCTEDAHLTRCPPLRSSVIERWMFDVECWMLSVDCSMLIFSAPCASRAPGVGYARRAAAYARCRIPGP